MSARAPAKGWLVPGGSPGLRPACYGACAGGRPACGPCRPWKLRPSEPWRRRRHRLPHLRPLPACASLHTHSRAPVSLCVTTCPPLQHPRGAMAEPPPGAYMSADQVAASALQMREIMNLLRPPAGSGWSSDTGSASGSEEDTEEQQVPAIRAQALVPAGWPARLCAPEFDARFGPNRATPAAPCCCRRRRAMAWRMPRWRPRRRPRRRWRPLQQRRPWCVGLRCRCWAGSLRCRAALRGSLPVPGPTARQPFRRSPSLPLLPP